VKIFTSKTITLGEALWAVVAVKLSGGLELTAGFQLSLDFIFQLHLL